MTRPEKCSHSQWKPWQFGLVRPSDRDLMFMFRQLSTFLNAGVSLGEALNAVSNTREAGRTRKVASLLRDRFSAGEPLSESMKRLGPLFPPLVLALTEIGERTGKLDEFFRTIAEAYQSKLTARKKLISAALYPMFVAVCALFLLPLPELFLPATGTSSQVHSYFTRNLYPLMACFGVVWGWSILGPILMQAKVLARIRDTVILSLPLIGRLMRVMAYSRYFRTFAQTLRAGLELQEILELANQALANVVLQAKVRQVQRGLKRGERLAESLAKTRLFRPDALSMIAVGEQTGTLDENMVLVAEHLEQEAFSLFENSAKLTGPALTLAVGGYIAYKVIAFYSAYFGGIANVMP